VRVGWKTLSAFALVLGAGVAVFTVLPRFVSERPVEDVEEVPETPPSAVEAPEIAEAPADVP